MSLASVRSALAVVAAFACAVEVSGAQQSVSPPVSSPASAMFDRLFAEYAAGNRAAVVNGLTSAQDCARIQPALVPSTKALLAGEWQRDKAGFVIELAANLAQCAPSESSTLISEGRLYVIGRPTRLGANPDEDAFELTWHLIAVTLLQRERATYASEVYLDTLERRYVTGPAAKAARSTLDPRFVLMRALAAEQRSVTAQESALRTKSPRNTDASVQSIEEVDAPAVPLPSYTAAVGTSLRQAAKHLERSAALAAVAAESNVRLAAVRFRSGEFASALTALEQARVSPDDHVLLYWAGLWAGRIYDALNRPADAERAYQRALDAWPAGQAAGVGLALMHLKQNHRAEAAAVSQRTQSIAPAAPDPWWSYYTGNARFIGGWLAQLRELPR